MAPECGSCSWRPLLTLSPRLAAHVSSLARKCAGWIVEDLNAAGAEAKGAEVTQAA